MPAAGENLLYLVPKFISARKTELPHGHAEINFGTRKEQKLNTAPIFYILDSRLRGNDGGAGRRFGGGAGIFVASKLFTVVSPFPRKRESLLPPTSDEIPAYAGMENLYI